MQVRLQKYLAECGVASRRKAEEYIADGRVMVNKLVVTTLGSKVDSDNDVVEFDGKVVRPSGNLVYIMLHKPFGYVTTVKDQFDRASVMDLIYDITERVYPIGRLDFDTSGMLLLTNDGDLAYKLTHPRHNVDKVYIAKVDGVPTKEEMNRFRNGLAIEDYVTASADIELLGEQDNHSICKIMVHEGRNRQVKKMCEAIGHQVISLKRIGIGEMTLGDLPKGKYRQLTSSEVEYLKALCR